MSVCLKVSGRRGTVEVDGVDISGRISHCRLVGDPFGWHLRLTVPIRASDEVDVELDDDVSIDLIKSLLMDKQP